MNILFLANHLNTGGISSYLLTLSAGLIKDGHQVYIASSGGELEDKFSCLGVTLIKVALNTKKEISPKIFFSFFKLYPLVKKYKIELVHSHSRTTQVLGCLLSRYGKIAHVFTCHGFFKPKFSRRTFPCWGEKVIAISEPVKKHLIGDLRLSVGKIELVPSGVDTQRQADKIWPEKIKQELEVTSGPLIGIIGRLSDVKGHTYLISALPDVLASFPDAKLLIVGEGKMQRELEKQIAQLGIKDKVFFLSKVENMANVLSLLDIFVMPSLQEGLGLSLMEAMAFGAAVIGSDVGGIKTLIQNQINGILVKPKDISGLSKVIIDLLGNPEKRVSLGLSAKKFISENFSAQEMVLKTEKVYQQCVVARSAKTARNDTTNTFRS